MEKRRNQAKMIKKNESIVEEEMVYVRDNRQNYRHWRCIHRRNELNVDENRLELYEYEK